MKKATFAGGCFWCMEHPFRELEGVAEAVSGYTGGTGTNPTYGDYASKGHLEAVQVVYDPSKVRYADLLRLFWRQIDPTDAGGQFADRGPQYRSAIFYYDDEQKKEAEASKRALGKSENSPPRSPRRSFRRDGSTGPRSITRSTARSAPSATRPTGSAPGGTGSSKSTGATTLKPPPRRRRRRHRFPAQPARKD